MVLLITATYYLLYWPEEEEKVTVAPESVLLKGQKVGELCEVKIGRARYA